jgi:UDP-MurNAc hydroxylase
MKSQILWINHAGYELRTGGLRIVHDPWIDGLVFDNGWALMSPTKYTPNDFNGCDYIWLSHEHPDHFSPSTLGSIPEATRRSITVLFQETLDKRVINYCRNIGFRTIELKDGKKFSLNSLVTITCGRAFGRDSWLLVESDDCTIFNANDCVGDWTKIASQLKVSVDVLLTQFSYANWVGNPEDSSRMKLAAAGKMKEMESQISAIKPHIVVPFASFAWFCRPENFHLNEHANTISEVVATLRQALPVVVLYPGDTYTLHSTHDNTKALQRYAEDERRRSKPIDFKESIPTVNDIVRLSLAEQQRLKKINRMWILKPLNYLRFFRPVGIYCRDLDYGFKYSVSGGILESGIPRIKCDVEMNSTSFQLMLKTGYGFSTLAVNGRYTEITPNATAMLGKHFAISAKNEEGYNVPNMFLNARYMRQKSKLLLLQLRQSLTKSRNR